jgi:hypothetical protein
MSLLVIKAPSSPLTTSALTELDAAVHMFANAAPSCPVAAHHLVCTYLNSCFSATDYQLADSFLIASFDTVVVLAVVGSNTRIAT